MNRLSGWARSAGRWTVRAITPSQAGWAGATWALVAFWSFLFVSFLAHDVLPQFSVGKLAGLIAMLGALALAGFGGLLALRLLILLRPGYRAAVALMVPVTVMVLLSVWDTKGGVIATLLLLVGLSLTSGAATSLFRRKSTGRSFGTVIFLTIGLLALGTLVSGMLRTSKAPILP